MASAYLLKLMADRLLFSISLANIMLLAMFAAMMMARWAMACWKIRISFARVTALNLMFVMAKLFRCQR